MGSNNLNKKKYEARLSDEREIVHAWLTNRYESNSIKHVSDQYRFERVSDDILRLIEVVDKQTHEEVEPDSDHLEEIALKLIRAGEAMEVQGTTGLMVAQLNVV